MSYMCAPGKCVHTSSKGEIAELMAVRRTMSVHSDGGAGRVRMVEMFNFSYFLLMRRKVC